MRDDMPQPRETQFNLAKPMTPRQYDDFMYWLKRQRVRLVVVSATLGAAVGSIVTLWVM